MKWIQNFFCNYTTSLCCVIDTQHDYTPTVTCCLGNKKRPKIPKLPCSPLPMQTSGYNSFLFFVFFFNLIIAFKYALAISRRQMGLFILAVKEHPFSSTYFLKYIKRFKFRYLKLPLDGTLLKHLPFQKPFCSLPFHMPFSTSPDKIAQSKFQLKCLMVFTLSSNC